MKMCVWILFWVVKKVQCLLHEFVKFYITFFSFMFFLRLWRVFFFFQVFMFTVLSFLILNKLNFEYFYEYFSESKYKNLFTLICDNIRQSTLNHFFPQKDIYFKHLHNKKICFYFINTESTWKYMLVDLFTFPGSTLVEL